MSIDLRGLARKEIAILCLAALVTVISGSCVGTHDRSSTRLLRHVDCPADPESLALRFAPILHLHPQEPYPIIAIIAVLHPEEPLIAYHIFFEDDAFMAGRGKSCDHEVMWIQYDPITLKVCDVPTLWHRTVLRTEFCLMNAKASGQRPNVDIQWGQHGILPAGWMDLQTARPRLELWAHYQLMHHASRMLAKRSEEERVSFPGSYDQYIDFSAPVDAKDFLRKQKVILADHPADELRDRTGLTFALKKNWPSW